MTMSKEFTVRDSPTSVGIPDPQGVVDVAANAAKVLSKVLEQKPKPVIINGEKYLEFEDWETLGQFYGVTVITGEALPVEIGGVKGAKAIAKLVDFHNGEIVGGAEAYCMRDEEKWGTRPKYEWQGEGKDAKKVKVGDEPVPWYQLASMAQTRAGAKAFRNRLAWVAVLAGYRPTPAEEMVDVESIREQSQTEHYCHEHNTAFFKRGKMKSFAHPIGDTGEWCYERSPFASTEPKEKKSKDKEKEEPPTKSESEHSEPEKITGSISWETVYPKVNTLFKNKVGDWTMDGILAKMAGLGADISSNKFHVSFETLTDENKAQFSAMADKALQGKEGKLL